MSVTGGMRERAGHGVDMLVGREVCEIVTTGMYTDPLSFYREYIQNAVDALAEVGNLGEGTIKLAVDARERSVTMMDNGPGMEHGEAVRALVPVGDSGKRRGVDRGFRGIGRLSALAFADRVRFLTRREGDDVVTEVVWNGETLRERLRDTRGAGEVIRACVGVREVDGGRYPAHFFEVRVEGVHRYVAGTVLNSVMVRDYVGEVCPVPMGTEFPFSQDVEELLACDPSLASVSIVVNGRDEPITRPFGSEIKLSASKRDEFTEFEPITIPAVGTTGHSAIGWLTHSRYRGAVPRRARIRGLRLRVGNIQVGGEGVFDFLFPESRFNRWCVGEIHVVDRRLVPNARRDYLEAGPHTRNLENHLRAVCRRIARRCRDASRGRLRERKVLSALQEADDGLQLAASGYLTQSQAKEIVSRVVEDLEGVRESVGTVGVRGLTATVGTLAAKAAECEVTCDGLEKRGITSVEANVYRKCFGAIVKESQSLGAAKKAIEAIVAALGREDML